MKRYFRRARKSRKSYRKKRMVKSYRKSAGGKFNTRADAGYFEKITKQSDLTVDAGATFAQMVVNWTATGASGASELFLTGGGGNIS